MRRSLQVGTRQLLAEAEIQLYAMAAVAEHHRFGVDGGEAKIGRLLPRGATIGRSRAALLAHAARWGALGLAMQAHFGPSRTPINSRSSSRVSWSSAASRSTMSPRAPRRE